MSWEIDTIEKMPPLVRGGGAKNAEEREQLRKLLEMGPGVNHRIKGIQDKKQYATLQQRIRTLAKGMGVSVTIRYMPEDNALAFCANEQSEVAQNVTTTEPTVISEETKTTSRKK